MSPIQMSGSATINTRGLIAETNLVFDSTARLQQTFRYDQPGQNLTVNLDLASTPSENGILGAGNVGGAGSITIRNGAVVTCGGSIIGSGKAGVVTVTGTSSTWNVGGPIFVANGSGGTLNVTNGGTVNCLTSPASNPGVVWVGGSGGGPAALNVTGGGVIDSAAGWLVGENGSPSIASVTGHGSAWTNSAGMTVCGGTLVISNGGSVSDSIGALGYYATTPSAVTVSGAGSTWINSSGMWPGWLEFGGTDPTTLTITAGGKVASNSAWVQIPAQAGEGQVGPGPQAGTATITVDGAGSEWTNSGNLQSGSTATMNITGGGAVAVGSLSVAGLLSLDVGRGSLLTVGNGAGTFYRGGTLRVVAGADVPAGSSYAPVLAGTWTGSGTDRAIGGTWNTANHRFTVSQALAGASGTPVTIDESQRQRILITDPVSGKSVGASFLATTSSTAMSLTASPLTVGSRMSLESVLPADESVLAGWAFSATGYTTGDPVYLSLALGGGYSRQPRRVEL